MAKGKNQTSFAKEGYKRIFCYNCFKFISESHLGEKKKRIIRCRKCKTYNRISPPKPGEFGGETGIFFGPNQTMFTAVDEGILKEEFGEAITD